MKDRLDHNDIRIILAYADGNMNGTQAAKIAYYTRESIYEHLDKICALTGLNPRNFYDLIVLVKQAKEGKLLE